VPQCFVIHKLPVLLFIQFCMSICLDSFFEGVGKVNLIETFEGK